MPMALNTQLSENEDHFVVSQIIHLIYFEAMEVFFFFNTSTTTLVSKSGWIQIICPI